MGIKIKKRPNLLRKTTRANERAQRAFKRAVLQHETKINQQALAGKDFEGKQMRGYKASYKKWRLKENLSSNVNLSVTGGMLKALSSKITLKKNGTAQGKIFIASRNQRVYKSNKYIRADEKARKVIDLGFNFFGISKKDKYKMIERVKNAFLKGMRE